MNIVHVRLSIAAIMAMVAAGCGGANLPVGGRAPDALDTAMRSTAINSFTQVPDSILYAFQGNPKTANPSGLIGDSSGALYGEAWDGGGSAACTGGCGAVYKLTPPAAGHTRWTQTILHAFSGSSGDGANPTGGLLLRNGAIYGATYKGGSSSCSCGVVFRLTHETTGWVETVLHTFQGPPGDGSYPATNIVADGSGNLYGTAEFGGQSTKCNGGCGAAFKIAAGSLTESLLHSFSGVPDGTYPNGLMIDSHGNLFGTTLDGGDKFACGGPGCGTAFEIPGAGTNERVIYNFGASTSDASAPAGPPVQGANGVLYGITPSGGPTGTICMHGCGTVYALTPSSSGSWTEHILHNFSSATNDGGLISTSAGVIYGDTFSGGTLGGGDLFSLTPPSPGGTSWKFQVVHTFGGSGDGTFPTGAPLLIGGTLYGTTDDGGSACNCGVVYSLVP